MSDAEKRKLWFDYLKILNERYLQSAQRSGFTTYLLLVAIAGIVYKFVPSIPAFLKTPGNFAAATIFFLLEADLFCLLAGGLAVLDAYCTEGSEFRAIPEQRRRVNHIGLTLLTVLLSVIAIAHVVIVWRGHLASNWLRCGLIVLGLYWVLNVVSIIWKEVSKIRSSLKHKVPIPRFSGLPFEPNLPISLGVVTFTTLLVGVSVLCLVFFAKSFSPDWTQPWKAASVSLAFCILFLYALSRWVLAIGQGGYLKLERDILLQNLSSDEIRARFVKQLVGSNAAQWLEEVLAELKDSNVALEKSLEFARRQLQEIRNINADYLAERKSRTKKLLEEFKMEMDRYDLQVEQFKFRIDLFFDGYLGPEEREAVFQWRPEFFSTFDHSKRLVNDVGAFFSEMTELQ